MACNYHGFPEFVKGTCFDLGGLMQPESFPVFSCFFVFPVPIFKTIDRNCVCWVVIVIPGPGNPGFDWFSLDLIDFFAMEKYYCRIFYIKENYLKPLTEYNTLSRRTTILNQLGMHARPAAMIAKLARNAEAELWIGDGVTRADASSVIDILSLGCARGYEVLLEAENEDDIHILDSIKKLIDTGFGENIDG